MFVLHAKLEHLAIVTWAVPAERIAALLPDPLVPDPVDPAGRYALFSMAAMCDATLKSQYAQINERAYVVKKDGTGAGAFFWKSHAASTQADLFRWLLGIPEFHSDVDLTIKEDRETGHHLVCTFDGSVVLDMNIDQKTTHIGAPYLGKGINVAKALAISKNPLIGYTLDWGELCATKVWHNEIKGSPVNVVSADPRFMVPAVTLDEGLDSQPIFAVYQPATPFHILLPPQPVHGWWRMLARLFLPGSI
jgi:hypothetical protein